MPDKIRLDHKCEQSYAERFLAAVGRIDGCVLKDFQPVTDRCHIIRYKYLFGKEKVAVVYDTKAHLLSITAPQPILTVMRAMLTEPSPQPAPTKQESPAQLAQKKQQPPKPQKKPSPQPAQKKQPAPKEQPATAQRKQETVKVQPEPTPNKQAAPQTKTQPEPPEGGDYTVKKFTEAQFEGVLKGVKKLKGVTYRLEGTSGEREEQVKTYLIKNNVGLKVKLRYMPAKKVLQLQGKRSNLYGEVQAIIAGDTDYESAVKPHIEQVEGGVRTGEVQKMLKKRLPDAFEYLSEQSKIDLTIGLIDIYNNENKLTDYSSLLTPPYRGLEKFISDLQKAQGIEVKLIGQAFDKTDGVYTLKNSYQRRIRSVVYAEVLAALYTEYFARRNFYLHSDNSVESAPRMIGDKNEVRMIFDRLLYTINYNSKKLKEIGFSVNAKPKTTVK